ncbi:MAG: SGNH/GDSL hydrolase family protein [Planctomycetota bacterium]|nr:SGNH/GDSL hydrolase family protein [Planctomycetota bacterium]
MRRPVSWRAKLALVLVGLLVAFVAVESSFRVYKYVQQEQQARDWLAVKSREVAAAGPEDRVSLGHLIEPSEDADIIYRLLPDLDVGNYFGGSVQSNSHGMRGPDCAIAKPDSTFRILGLGDSVMFGNGVNNGENFLRVLEDELNARRSEDAPRYEAINMAMGGYNTTMEVAHFLHHGLAFGPDLVVIDFVSNDFQLPNFLAGRTDFKVLDRSFFIEWVERRLGTRRYSSFAPLVGSPRRLDPFLSDIERVQPEYRHMVGHAAYRVAMHKLRDLAEEHGFAVVVTSHGPGHKVVAETAEECGFPLVIGRGVLASYLQEHGIDDYRGSVLTLSASDPHPSALGHQLLGRYYAERFLELGLLDRSTDD